MARRRERGILRAAHQLGGLARGPGIDRIISRTLSYALVTGLIIDVYIGVVTLATRVWSFPGQVGVAASTLIAAVLFNPLRKRVQRVVDRRFNRAHYDAEATVAAFAGRLRESVDLPSMENELAATPGPRSCPSADTHSVTDSPRALSFPAMACITWASCSFTAPLNRTAFAHRSVAKRAAWCARAWRWSCRS